MKKPAVDKHFSLWWKYGNYRQISFITMGPGYCLDETSTLVGSITLKKSIYLGLIVLDYWSLNQKSEISAL